MWWLELLAVLGSVAIIFVMIKSAINYLQKNADEEDE